MRKCFFIPCLLSFISCYLLFVIPAAASSLTHVSDTISNSAPDRAVNHTIKFTVPTTLPPSGKIVITPEEGYFEIPAAMNYTALGLAVDGTDRDLAETSDSNNDGVTVVSGNSGNITITLDSTDGIAAGSQIIIEIGIQYQQIRNPSSVGSYKINIKTYDASSVLLDRADAMVAVVEQVTVGEAAVAICGNGVVSGDEECDDGNTVSGDGCSATCQIEIPPVIPLAGSVPPVILEEAPATGTGPVTVEPELEGRPGDLNGDGKVDLVDFSILLYNWGEPKNPKADINNDGVVDLVDLSIMFYWWTG